MMIGKRDLQYGLPIYAPVWKWAIDGAIHSVFNGAALALNGLFEHIYFKYSVPNSSGIVVDQWIDVGLNASEIESIWLQLYGERRVAFPYYPCSDEGNTASLYKMTGALVAVLDKWTWKYKKLVATMGLTYNPIENYNMAEEGTDTDTPTGTTTKSHQVDAEKVGMIKLTGVADMTSTTITQDAETGKYTINSLALDEAGSKLTKADGISDIENGKKADRTNDAISVANGDTLTQKNYTTTMDSAAESRLHNYNETLGDVAQASYNNLTEQIPIMAEVQSGNPHFASYTDTESFTSRVNTKVHNFSRSGNIGVTTSQQMIEQERNLVKFSVIEEFFKDLNHELLLAVWD